MADNEVYVRNKGIIGGQVKKKKKATGDTGFPLRWHISTLSRVYELTGVVLFTLSMHLVVMFYITPPLNVYSVLLFQSIAKCL
jgi:hypothetical protein